MENITDPLLRPYIDPSWPFQLFSECLSIPTLILFFFISYQHYKKGFNGAFQKLVYITILNDMWCYYNQMFFLRWPQMGLFGFYLPLSQTFVPNLFGYSALVTLCHQHFFVLLIAVNRMHSLFSPLNFTLFWDAHFTKLIVFFFLLPQPLSMYICFTQRVHYRQFALNTGYLYSDGMAGPCGKVFLSSMCVVCIATITFNVLSIVKLFMWKKSSEKGKGKLNSKLHFYSFYIFLLELLYDVTEVGINITVYGTFWSKFCTISSNVVLDLFCLSSIWIWLLMSTDARRLIFGKKRNVIDINFTTYT